MIKKSLFNKQLLILKKIKTIFKLLLLQSSLKTTQLLLKTFFPIFYSFHDIRFKETDFEKPIFVKELFHSLSAKVHMRTYKNIYVFFI